MGGAPTIVWLRPGVGYTPAAAASMRRLERRLGRAHDCNSSYRDYNEQLKMYNDWNRYVQSGYNPRYKPNHSRAIHPDASMHCKGLADDSDDWTTPGYIALAEEYGWIRTAADDPTERHHFEYQEWRDQHRNDPDPEEDDMFTDADRALLQDVQNRIRGPKDRPYDMLQSIDSAALETRVRIRGPLTRNWDMLQEIERLLNNDTKPTELKLNEEDRKAIAASVTEMLPAVLGTLSDDTIKTLVDRLLDEQSKRLQS